MTPSDPTAVRCAAIRKHFGEDDARVEVLRGVDYTVQRGELSFLVGPSGCGMTTLKAVIAGHLEPEAGEVDSVELDPAGSHPQDSTLSRHTYLGFVYHAYHVPQAPPAARNASLPCLRRCGPSSRAR